MIESTKSTTQRTNQTTTTPAMQLLTANDPQSLYDLHHIDHPSPEIVNPKLTTNNYVA